MIPHLFLCVRGFLKESILIRSQCVLSIASPPTSTATSRTIDVEKLLLQYLEDKPNPATADRPWTNVGTVGPPTEGILRLRSRPTVAYDQQGLIFAVAMEGGAIKLFDSRSYDKGPFDTFLVGGDMAEVCDIKFSNDGKSMLLTTTSNNIYVLDAYVEERRDACLFAVYCVTISLQYGAQKDDACCLSKASLQYGAQKEEACWSSMDTKRGGSPYGPSESETP